MSIREVTMYQVWCDWPGCEANSAYGEYYAWSEPDHAEEYWNDSDGLTDDVNYCDKHSIAACEIDQGCDGDDVTHRALLFQPQKAVCCVCYRTTHFVEVGPCCAKWKNPTDG